jgi:hypothetical protein
MVNKTLRDYVATGRYVGNFQSERLRLVRIELYLDFRIFMPNSQAAEIASGLAYLHAQNIAHGDIKDVCMIFWSPAISDSIPRSADEYPHWRNLPGFDR